MQTDKSRQIYAAQDLQLIKKPFKLADSPLRCSPKLRQLIHLNHTFRQLQHLALKLTAESESFVCNRIRNNKPVYAAVVVAAFFTFGRA